MKNKRIVPMTLSGRYFSEKEIRLVKSKVSKFPGLSRTELSRELSKELSWYQSNGKAKHIGCLNALKKLEALGYIKLPAVREAYVHKSTRQKVTITYRSDPQEKQDGRIDAYSDIKIEPVKEKSDTRLWKEYIQRYHYLGYKTAFGSQQKYFIKLNGKIVVGCLLYSASAWRVECRDKWIGWSEKEKMQRLHLVINNSRFLIFPWIKIKNLASKVLSHSANQIRDDWQKRYKYQPVLLESFVDPERYRGVCYQASNWQKLGCSKGRGRMGRSGEYKSTPKEVFVYPLIPSFRKELKGGKASE